ncbi:MAG: hypothetical protein H7249_14260 [Chitinophagaceae bacterium]|nr:hypothetical protein [Oligoflexus sp.]
MGIRWSREPYTVTYYKDGKKETIRRVPPPKLHEALPGDTVSLTRGKNDDFKEGDKFTVKTIQQRSPNVLQLTNEAGLTTFADYYDTKLETKPEDRLPEGVEQAVDLPINQKYLLWP